MFCWKCGREVKDTMSFCPMCGTSLKMPGVPQDMPHIAPQGTSQDTPWITQQDVQQSRQQDNSQDAQQRRQQRDPQDAQERRQQRDPQDAQERRQRRVSQDAQERRQRRVSQDAQQGEPQGAYWEATRKKAKSTSSDGGRRNTGRTRSRAGAGSPSGGDWAKYVDMGAGMIGIAAAVPFVIFILQFLLSLILYVLFLPVSFRWGLRDILFQPFNIIRTVFRPVFWILSTLNTVLFWVLLVCSIAVAVGLIILLLTRPERGLVATIVGVVVCVLVLILSIIRIRNGAYQCFSGYGYGYTSLYILRGHSGPVSIFAGIPRFLLGTVIFLLGMDLFVKVFVNKQGVTGIPDPAEDAAALKKMFEKSEEKVDVKMYTDPNLPRYEETPEIEEGESYFDGTGLGLLGLNLLMALLTMITCSLATPWVLVKKIKWETSHTIIEGKRLSFNGTALGLFGHWIKWMLLSIITCGLYLYYVHVDYRKWVVRHTTYEGRELPAGTDYSDSYFEGSFAEYLGTGILSSLLTTVTCGIGYPWAVTMVHKYDIKGTVVGGDQYFYDGTGGGLLGRWILNGLLTIITCGIYSSWAECAINRYLVCHTHIDATKRRA